MPLAEILIREAAPDETSKLCDLLQSIGLVTEGVLVPGTRYWMAEGASQELLGLVGIEFGASDAVLLRSAAVAPQFQRRGIGGALVNHALNTCADLGYRRVYCFSTDAGDYWQYSGFREVPVQELVEALPSAPQVHHFDRIGWLPTEIAWRKDI
jgi:N-acetylglutamate synthase-like GNAT family acetyltransferase